MATFFEDVLPYLKTLSARSLSTFWKEKYANREKEKIACAIDLSRVEDEGSLFPPPPPPPASATVSGTASSQPLSQAQTHTVQLPTPSQTVSQETGDGLLPIPSSPNNNNPSSSPPHPAAPPLARDLHYLNQPLPEDEKHDPCLIVRTIYDHALMSLFQSSKEEQNVLLQACLLLASRSGRASHLLLCALLSFILFQDDLCSIEKELLEDLYRYSMESMERDGSETIAEELVKEHLRLSQFFSKAAKENNDSIVFSCGKADHGKLDILIV